MNKSGQPVFEVLPAKPVNGDVYEILGSPALAYGFAAGDHLRMSEDGEFEVLRRGGNLCIRIYPSVFPSETSLGVLTEDFELLGGWVEWPSDRRFIVITVPVVAGFLAVEKAVGEWADEHGWVWGFGNVYDEQDNAIGWWRS